MWWAAAQVRIGTAYRLYTASKHIALDTNQYFRYGNAMLWMVSICLYSAIHPQTQAAADLLLLTQPRMHVTYNI